MYICIHTYIIFLIFYHFLTIKAAAICGKMDMNSLLADSIRGLIANEVQMRS
jgi:hypothetical protein